MRFSWISAIFLFLFPMAAGATDATDVLGRLTRARFSGNGTETVGAVAGDASGNIYVTGITTSTDLAVKNAAQPAPGGWLVWRTADGGATWTAAGSPAIGTPYTVQADPKTAGVAYAGGSAGLAKTSDGGATWKMVYTPKGTGGVYSVAIHPEDSLHVWAVTADGVMESRDGGGSWTVRADVAPYGSVSDLPSLMLADPAGSGAVAALGSSWLRLSRDGGAKWTTLSLPASASYQGFQNFAFDAAAAGTLYAGTTRPGASMVVVSTDWGANWKEQPALANWSPALKGLLSDPERGGVLYATYHGGTWYPDGIYRSTDGGATWSTGALPVDVLKRAAALRPSCTAGGLLAITTGTRLAASADYGTTWTTTRLGDVTDVSAGAGCQAWALTTQTGDAYVAKLKSDGTTEWLTYLGGSRTETVAGLAVDASGNVYVAGSTTSSDFPATLEIGDQTGTISPLTYTATHAFLTKLSASGTVVYSALLGSAISSAASAVAADASGNAYLLGSGWDTYTAGAFRTETGGAGYPRGGSLMKLGPTGTVLYSTYLAAEGTGSTPMSVAANSAGEAYVSGTGAVPTVAGAATPAASTGFLVRVNAAGTGLSYAQAIEQDAAGKLGTDTGARAYLVRTREPDEVYLAGVTSAVPASGGGYVSPLTGLGCATYTPGLVSQGDTYVTKLKGAKLAEQFTAVLGGACRTTPVDLAVGTDGSIGLALRTGRSFPMVGATVGAPTCDVQSMALARISSDGTALSGSTYLDVCGSARVAMSGTTAYAGVTRSNHGQVAGFETAGRLRLDRAAEGFSGYGLWVVPGSFVTIYGNGLSDGYYDFGLADPTPLSKNLDGTEVWFDDVRAPMVQLDAGKTMVTVPFGLSGWTRIRVVRGETATNELWMPVRESYPSVWTVDFPRTAEYGELATGSYPYAIAINEDGVQNDAQHPAKPGSKIWLFTTGVGTEASPTSEVGVAATESAATKSNLSACWSDSYEFPQAFTIPQFLTSLLQVQVQVPAVVTGDQVQRIPFSFGMFSTDRTQRSGCPNVMSGGWVTYPGPVAGIYVK
jgi:uncharacterized protein (TIGR03437 family)